MKVHCASPMGTRLTKHGLLQTCCIRKSSGDWFMPLELLYLRDKSQEAGLDLFFLVPEADQGEILEALWYPGKGTGV